MPAASPVPLPPTEVELWLRDRLDVVPVESARGLYELMPLQRNGQLPFVDVPYDPYNEAHWADASRVADYAAQLPSEGGRVLDIGPGDGWPSLPIAALRPDAQVIGVDASPLRVAVCTANAHRLGLANASFVAADGARLPFCSGSFDLVTAASSIEEAEDADGVLREAARVLRPGGIMRASYQDWRLGVPGWESVMLWSGAEDLLYTYVRRVQDPPIERRYTVVLHRNERVEAIVADALMEVAGGRRAYGETLLTPRLGVPLLELLEPHSTRCLFVEMRRWNTEQLVSALLDAGFSTARGTVHAGELGRHFAREALRAGSMDRLAPLFREITASLGGMAASLPGEAMVVAVR